MRACCRTTNHVQLGLPPKFITRLSTHWPPSAPTCRAVLLNCNSSNKVCTRNPICACPTLIVQLNTVVLVVVGPERPKPRTWSICTALAKAKMCARGNIIWTWIPNHGVRACAGKMAVDAANGAKARNASPVFRPALQRTTRNARRPPSPNQPAPPRQKTGAHWI